jgi:hypothetical protein
MSWCEMPWDTEMAETEGFEPSVPVNPVRRFSKPLVSATHPRLRTRRQARAIAGVAAAINALRTRFGTNST